MSDRDPASAIAEAIEHHRSGRLVEARDAYARVLQADPDEPNALNFLGMMHVQYGDARLGAQLIKRATDVATDFAGAHANLGTALVEIGEFDDARASYENALAVDPGHAEAHNNLGVLLRYDGDVNGSIAHLMMATELRPGWATAQLNLGSSFAHTRNHEKAIEAYMRAVEADPELMDAYRRLGHVFYARGELDKAKAIFDKILMIEPDNAIAQHMRAAVTGEEVPDRASKGYVASTFDTFAASFDAKLQQLEYKAPFLVLEELERRLGEPKGALRCLDLGAGTGLCGPLVDPWVRELVGVDLSPEMLKRAARREVYSELLVADLVEYLHGDVGEFDLMISADVLIYFGAIAPLLRAATARLAPSGWLVFTCEKSERDDGYELGPSGRYAHGRGYLEACLDGAGLETVAIEERIIRSELQAEVTGWVVTARRAGARLGDLG